MIRIRPGTFLGITEKEALSSLGVVELVEKILDLLAAVSLTSWCEGAKKEL